MSSAYRRLFLGCLLSAAIVPTITVAEDAVVVSNLDLMSKLTGEAARELVESVPGDVEWSDVTLAGFTRDEQYQFTDNVFARVLTSAGHTVYESGQKGSTTVEKAPLRLEYQALNFGLSYPKIYRPYLIGGKRVKRKAEVHLLAKLIDPADGSVKWIGETSRSHEDRFPYGDLAAVEAGTFAFTKPPRSSTKWGKIVEPVVVTGIIVGLIYLFFSNQDDS
jgi:hypothetical protein